MAAARPRSARHSERPGDLCITMPEGTQYTVDVSLCNPSCHSMLMRKAYLNEDAAALIREKDKRDQYAHLEAGGSRHFTPFVIESTGRLGPSANMFLKTIVSNEGMSALTYFYNALSAMSALYNALMLKGARRKLSSLEKIVF